MTFARLATVALVTLLWSASALASQPEDEAKRWYKLGVSAAEDGRWKDAAAAFDQANAIAPSPALRFNAAQALARSGQLDRARYRFEALLIAADTPRAIRERVTAALVDLDQVVILPPPAKGAPPEGTTALRFRTALQQGYRVQVTDRSGANQACHDLVGPKAPCVLHVTPGEVRVLIEGGVSINTLQEVPEVGLTLNLHTQGSGLLAGSVAAWSAAALSLGLVAAGSELESTNDLLLFSLGLFFAATTIPTALGFTVAYADHDKVTTTLGAADYDAAQSSGPAWSGVAVAPADGGALVVTGGSF